MGAKVSNFKCIFLSVLVLLVEFERSTGRTCKSILLIMVKYFVKKINILKYNFKCFRTFEKSKMVCAQKSETLNALTYKTKFYRTLIIMTLIILVLFTIRKHFIYLKEHDAFLSLPFHINTSHMFISCEDFRDFVNKTGKFN